MRLVVTNRARARLLARARPTFPRSSHTHTHTHTHTHGTQYRASTGSPIALRPTHYAQGWTTRAFHTPPPQGSTIPRSSHTQYTGPRLYIGSHNTTHRAAQGARSTHPRSRDPERQPGGPAARPALQEAGQPAIRVTSGHPSHAGEHDKRGPGDGGPDLCCFWVACKQVRERARAGARARRYSRRRAHAGHRFSHPRRPLCARGEMRDAGRGAAGPGLRGAGAQA